MPKILIVDDESDIRELISDILEDEGHKTESASNASTALKALEESMPDAVILDIWLEGSEMDGIGVLKQIKEKAPHIPVIMISGHGNIETAVQTIQLGAYDFIEKPFKAEKLLILVNRALQTANLARENTNLKQLQQLNSDLIGESKVIQTLSANAKLAAPANSRILITGEAGTGKEVLARMIHKHSTRKDKPFVTLHAINISESNMESELFGVDDGKTFTPGILEKANGGTLFIDEITDMPLKTQNKFLKALQQQTFQKMGSDKPISVDTRIISASSKNLEEEIKNGDLSQSLFYRLNVVPLHIPALRERKEDIKPLCKHIIQQFVDSLGLQTIEISDDAYAIMDLYDWPGNTRQLKNVIEWLMIMRPEKSNKITPQDLPNEITGTPAEGANDNDSLSNNIVSKPLKLARDIFEKEYLSTQLDRFEGNISKTAEFVGMERTALHRKIKSLDIKLKKVS